MPAVSIQNLKKKYGTLCAVDSISLEIEEGEVFGLLGPNGAGKTTTLMMLVTLVPPTSGTASVNGFDIVTRADKVRKSIGVVFQDPSSDETLTGYENLKLHGMLYDMPAPLREQQIAEVLALVGLTGRKDDVVKKYSGGMRRRLELARGLMHHPRILFLDEPTLGLDPQAREHIWEYVKNLAEKKNITIILTTHYMEEADRLCDRIAIIDRGKVAALGPPARLKQEIGGDRVFLQGAKGDGEHFRDLAFVTQAVPVPGGISLVVQDARRHLQEILARSGPVESVDVRPVTLEDVFLHYTGREMREGSPEGDWATKAMQAGVRR
ncbi:ATP-binding cassette domain-containing protein [Methanoregula sp.]|uniref:ATP-binding cassette domain-containing protein n=1 Tax=Methanoregula sp. TaxID=2052170 RepID=UPI002D054D63|nr:ATP-binding cassette domain-containing protein [Methanoregula sp.]HVP96800.1 ATP-binding cassette domain-containing protein [Methanoregula sp.]